VARYGPAGALRIDLVKNCRASLRLRRGTSV